MIPGELGIFAYKVMKVSSERVSDKLKFHPCREVLYRNSNRSNTSVPKWTKWKSMYFEGISN